VTPVFHNDQAAAEITIEVKEFKCIGQSPPMDHPHVYLNMGKETSILCPYCATKYIFEN